MDPASAPVDAVGHLDSTYKWIPILAGFVAFAWAMSVGAVDIPISFGPAIGSGALTLPQAVVFAALLEITGACLVSNRDVDTLVAHIMRRTPPGSDDALLMWGLFIALIVATVWLAMAVYWEIPASSSLAIWGAIIGVLLSVQGVTSVYWISSKDDSVLRVGGVLAIVLAWIVAPSLAGAMSFTLFGATKVLLLRADQSVRRTLRAMPIYYGVTVMVLIYFVIYRGSPRERLEDKINPGRATLIAGASGGLAACLAFLIVVPLAQKRANLARRDLTPADAHNNHSDIPEAPAEEGKVEVASPAQPEVTAEDLIQQFNERRVLPTVYEADEEEQSTEYSLQSFKARCSPANAPPPPQVRLSFGQLLAHTPNRLLSFQRLRTKPPPTPRQRLALSVNMFKMATFNHRFVYDRQTLIRHALAEKFDAKAEELFSFLQIMTACAAAFAHGSNEVAWAVGPFSAILQIYDHRRAEPGAEVQIWVLALGGVGVSLGFALFGWKIVRSIGGRLMFISPVRGFSAQLSAVVAVLVAYKVDLPLSTTHILIGALVGVGLSDGLKHVNWTLLATFVVAWAGLLLLTCGTCAALYSFTVYSPSYTT